MIDAHRIAPKLWMGSRPSPAACKMFDVIVLAAEEHQPELNCKTIRAPMDDGRPTQQEVILALKAAKQVNHERSKGRRVLVSCYMGVNRSGLVTALAMMLNGSSAKSAITRIRQARRAPITPLSNPHFVALLKRLEPLLKEQHNARGVV